MNDVTSPYNSFELISKLFHNPSKTSSNTTSFPHRLISLLFFVSLFTLLCFTTLWRPGIILNTTAPLAVLHPHLLPVVFVFFRFDTFSLQCPVHDSVPFLSRRCIFPSRHIFSTTSRIPFLQFFFPFFLFHLSQSFFFPFSQDFVSIRLRSLSNSRSPLFFPILSAIPAPIVSLSIHPVRSFLPALSILSIKNILFTASRLWSCNVFLVVRILPTFPSCHGGPAPRFPYSRRCAYVYFQFELIHSLLFTGLLAVLAPPLGWPLNHLKRCCALPGLTCAATLLPCQPNLTFRISLSPTNSINYHSRSPAHTLPFAS